MDYPSQATFIYIVFYT